MRSNFDVIKSTAERERKYAIDPRQEEPPHGEVVWPYWSDQLDDPHRDANREWSAVVLGLIGGFVIIALLLLGSIVSFADDATSEAIAKCGTDALRFCTPEISSRREGAVGYCLARHHKEIAVSCRQFMDEHPLRKGKR